MITVGYINKLISDEKIDKGSVSDGEHTFSELYAHRNTLFIVLCREILNNPQNENGQKSFIWKSLNYSDGRELEKGWFLMGIGIEKGEQITYHIPMSYWSKADFVITLSKAPLFDKHTPKDVLSRLFNL